MRWLITTLWTLVVIVVLVAMLNLLDAGSGGVAIGDIIRGLGGRVD